jgi:hypothetical protein
MVTAYRIRGGQIVEIRQHVDDPRAYAAFWASLTGTGPAAPEPVQESESLEEPSPRPKGFARFFR